MNFDIREPHSRVILGVMTAAYVAVLSAHCYLRFKTFGYYDWDLAVYDQIIWNLLRGDFFSSLLGVNFLGHHAHFLAFPVAVVYAAFPHALTLLFLQTLALGLAAVPLFFLAKKILDHRWALLVSFAYLMYHGVGYTNIYEFHYTSFAPLILFSMFYFFFAEKHVLFLAFAALALLCQENFSLLIFTFGLYAMFLRRSPRWWLPLLIGSAAYLIFCVKFLLPSLNPGTIKFSSIYSYWGRDYGEILRNLVLHPVAALQYMLTPKKVEWLWNIFAPLSFVPVTSPAHLLLVVPTFLQRLLSNRQQETMLFFHYLSDVFPFIFLAFIFGLKRVTSFHIFKSLKPSLAILLLATIIFHLFQLGPHLSLFSSRRTGLTDDDRIKEQWVGQVPRSASVVATFEFLPHISRRKDLYSFQYIYSGAYILSDRAYSLDKRVDLALIDFNDPFLIGSFYRRDGYKRTRDFLAFQQFSIKDVVNSMIFFDRVPREQKPLYEVLDSPPMIRHPLDIGIDDGLILKGYDIRRNGDLLEMLFYWQVAERTPYDFSMFFDIKDSKGSVVQRIPGPLCYRIYPTQAWDKNTWVVDHKYLLIPATVSQKDFDIFIGLAKMDSRERLPYFKLGGFNGRQFLDSRIGEPRPKEVERNGE